MSKITATIIGRICSDIEQRQTQSGLTVISFTTVCNEKVSGNDVATFMRCSAFGKTGDVIGQYFGKGKPIILHGTIRQESWVDKESGEKRSTHKFQAREFEFTMNDRDADKGTGGGDWESGQGGGGGSQPPSFDDLPF